MAATAVTGHTISQQRWDRDAICLVNILSHSIRSRAVPIDFRLRRAVRTEPQPDARGWWGEWVVVHLTRTDEQQRRICSVQFVFPSSFKLICTLRLHGRKGVVLFIAGLVSSGHCTSAIASCLIPRYGQVIIFLSRHLCKPTLVSRVAGSGLWQTKQNKNYVPMTKYHLKVLKLFQTVAQNKRDNALIRCGIVSGPVKLK